LAKRPRVLILNGPNLNMLGTREPEVYGKTSLADIATACTARAKDLGLALECRQTNSEGQLVDWIQQARADTAGLILNPGGLTHTSVALLDALLAVDLPTIEVHLSNIHRREDFRHHSYVSRAARGIVCGFGAQGYLLALDAMANWLKEKRTK
jgi:3-dehydroquinate dehydratase-2